MDSDAIRQVRRFNRLVTRRVGALDHSFLGRGRPLGEARVIFETGLAGAEVRALRAALGLDSGYVSRLLRSLSAQGLIGLTKPSGDARVRRVVLTAKGRAELAAYERLSDDLAQAMLAPLATSERQRLLAAMAEVERLLRAGAVVVGLEPATSPDVHWCLSEYFRELAERFDFGFDPAKGVDVSEAEMTPPSGWFFLARLDGRPVGCGALRRLGRSVGEVKRMWTAPGARGLGVARRIIAVIETTAREAALTTLRLDTNRALSEAQALYRKLGFVEIERYNDNPYANHWFEKRL
jgi:DNA-binding MarR family transcriptional regulator/GNAT superfamily N-acetyltransferase